MPWSSEILFTGGDEFYTRLLGELAQASRTIELESYLFELDPLGERILKVLRGMASQGVRVRILVDGVGSPAWSRELLEDLQKHEVEARIYHPYPWVRFSHRSFLEFFQFQRWWKHLNRRDHRKLCIIDGKVAFLGSFNIGKHHTREFQGEEVWRDTGARLEGEGVPHLQKAFEKTWLKSWGVRRKLLSLQDRFRLSQQLKGLRKIHPEIKLNSTFFLREYYWRELLEKIHGAQKRIWMTTAYFIPHPSLMRALRSAARSGVEVKILLPAKSDVRLIPWVTCTLLLTLLRAGVYVFEYQPRILHSKTLIIDNEYRLGSSNSNHRSWFHDLELDIILESPASHEELERNFRRDLTLSEEITLENWKKRFGLVRYLGGVASYFRYWM